MADPRDPVYVEPTPTATYRAPAHAGAAADETFATVMANSISWGAVFAGAVVALIAHLLFNMLGAGVGLAMIDPRPGQGASAETLSIAGAIWWVLTGILASFIGGFLAGRLSGRPREDTGAWHGITTWAVTTLAIVWLLTTTVGGLLGGAFSAVGNAAGGLAQAAVGVAAPMVADGDDPIDAVERRIRAEGGDPQSVRDAAIATVRAAFTGDPQRAAQAREEAAVALARAENIPLAEARARIARYEQDYRTRVAEAEREAARLADQAASTLAFASILSALALLLGAIAAWFGGKAGVVRQGAGVHHHRD